MRDYAGVSGSYTEEIRLLVDGLRAIDTPAVIVDAHDRVLSLTPAAARVLGIEEQSAIGESWVATWAAMGGDARALSTEPRRHLLDRGGRKVPVQAWRRSLGDSGTAIVGLRDLSDEEEREREVGRILHDLQEKTDDLFALYQITQFLNNEQDLDRLCADFLRELERITGSDAACLYLATPQGTLQPKVWEGIKTIPPAQPDIESARSWLQDSPVARSLPAAGRSHKHHNPPKGRDALQCVSTLPLLAEDRLVGLAVLRHEGELGRRQRFLQTVAKEMGTALRAMQGRQALFAQEQKLEAIVDSTTDAIIQVGPDLQVRHFNPAAERLTGYLTEDALTRTCRDVLGCTTGAQAGGCKGECPFARVLASREAIPYAEIEVVSGGERRYLAAGISALNPGRDLDAAAVGILRDVSKQKQIEQLKDDFLITVSHQLRTPVALLRGYVDTLLHLELSEQEQKNCIDGIGDTASRLEHLVGQILDVTRIEEGRFELHKEPIRVVDVLREAINTVPHIAYRSRIWTELAPNLPSIHVDPKRLEEVIINLLDNSFKYSPPAGQVVIRAAESTGEDGRLEVMVQIMDEGIGIPAEEQAAIFRKFQRGSNAQDLQPAGTGLGLFICRSIIEAHGGRISLSSTPGSGTCVTFWVPAVEEEI